MCRQLLFKVVLLAFFQGSVAEDVTVDVSKLTKFTTSFTLKMESLRKAAEATGLRMRPQSDSVRSGDLLLNSNITVTGKLIADIPGEKMKIRLDVDGRTFEGPPAPTVHPKGTVVLSFDGPSGYVAMEVNGLVEDLKGKFGKFESKGCAKYKFNPHMLPPPAMVKQMIEAKAPMVGKVANMLPHVVEGGIAYYKNRYDPFVFGLRASDGTPVAVWVIGPGGPNLDVRPDIVNGIPAALTFSEFTAPEPFSEVQCVDTPGLVLDSPLTQQALFLSEQLLTHLQLATPLSPVMQHVFAQLPQVIRNPDEKSCVLPVEAASTRIEPHGFFGLAAVGIAAAAVGAGIALVGARRALGKPEVGYVAIS